MNPDVDVVTAQLGRPPRGTWRVVARCDSGAPTVIAVAPKLEDGTPFPTTFWLTCPLRCAAVSDLESAGTAAAFTIEIRTDEVLAAGTVIADAAYREARRLEAGGKDPCDNVGIAGQRDPQAVKCLHARLAAKIAGIPDPVGASVEHMIEPFVADSCGDPRCKPPVSRG